MFCALNLGENMEKYIKNLINTLCQNAGYKVLEISDSVGLISNWAACRVSENSAEVVVFSDVLSINPLNNSALEQSLKRQLSCSFIYVKYVILEQKDSGDGDFKITEPMEVLSKSGIAQNIVVIDPYADTVLYFGNAAGHIANELGVGKKASNEKQDVQKQPLPILTYSLIAINVVAFIITAVLSGNFVDSDINVLVYLGAKVNSLISQGQYYRLITCMFLHGGIVHVGVNMYSLYIIGPLVEKIYGKAKFLIIYFVAGIMASYFSFLFSNSISIGASGAIFGLLGASLIFAMKMKDRIGKGFMMNIVTVIVINLVIGFSLANVDNFGHLGGLVGGSIVSYLVFNKIEKFS